jgi:hypothetical protein
MSTNTIDTQEPTEAQSSQPRPTLSLVFEQQFLGVPNGSRLQTRDRTRGYHGAASSHLPVDNSSSGA